MSQIYSYNETLHVSDISSVHHQEFFTVHTAMVYVIKVCWQLVSRSIFSRSQAVSKPVWHIPLLCVQWKTPDDGQRNCPKHVVFQSKIKIFEKLVQIFASIIRNLSRFTTTWTSNFVLIVIFVSCELYWVLLLLLVLFLSLSPYFLSLINGLFRFHHYLSDKNSFCNKPFMLQNCQLLA